MATHRIPIVGFNTLPDTTGDIFLDPISNQLTLTNSKSQLVMVMKDPNGSGDEGWHGKFHVPQNYVGTPVVVVEYVIDGTPANVVAFGIQLLPLADSEAFDAAYAAENIASNSTWTGYADEDLVEEKITIADTLAVGDEVFYFFYIDDGTHTFTGNVLVTGLYFEYADA